MIPKARLLIWLKIVACSILLASATPLPLGVASDDLKPISDVMTQDTIVSLTNIPDRDINSNPISISNLHTTSTFSKLKGPSHPTNKYVKRSRGKDDVAASKEKPGSSKDRKKREVQRKKRYKQLLESGELEDILSLSREERINLLQRRKKAQPGNTKPVEGMGKEPEGQDPQAMAYMMNTHHDDPGQSSSSARDDDTNQHPVPSSSSTRGYTHQYLGQSPNHAEWDYSMGAPQNFPSSAWRSTHQHPGQPSAQAEWDYTMGTPQNHGQSSSSSWAAPGPNHTPHQDQQWQGWDMPQ